MLYTGFKLDYIVLLTFMLFVIVVFSIQICKTRNSKFFKRKYIKYSFPIVIVFSLIEGLRYGRGIDYLHYVDLYNNAFDYNKEILFKWLMSIFRYLNFPFWSMFIIYSCIWVVSVLILMRNYKEIIGYALPFMVVFSLSSFECLIRQYLGLSFLLVSLHYYIRHDKSRFVVFSIIAFFFHHISILFSAYIFISGNFKKPFNPYISLTLYVFFVYIWDIAIIDYITPYIALFQFGEVDSFGGYTADANKWFSSDAIRYNWSRSFFTKFLALAFDGSLILLGRYYIKKYHDDSFKYTVVYNLFIISLLGTQAFFLIEILRRCFNPMYFMGAIIAALCCSCLVKECGQFQKIYVLRLCVKYYLLAYIVSLFVIKSIFLIPGQAFIWDQYEYRKYDDNIIPLKIEF